MVGNTLGRSGAEVADHVQGGLEMLRVGTAAIRGQEGHSRGKVRASVRGKPGETAYQGLVGVLALNKDIVSSSLMMTEGMQSIGQPDQYGVVSGSTLMFWRR